MRRRLSVRYSTQHNRKRMRAMRKQNRRKGLREIAAAVREAITHVPPLANITLEVLDEGIFPSSVADQTWWRVPVVASPAPERLFPVYELLAEIQQHLRDQK